jgi:hypothetical protein
MHEAEPKQTLQLSLTREEKTFTLYSPVSVVWQHITSHTRAFATAEYLK